MCLKLKYSCLKNKYLFSYKTFSNLIISFNMNKTFNFVFIIILITYSYSSGDSECENYVITPSSRRRISTDECPLLKTSDDSKYECILNARGNGCEEREKTSDCVQTKAGSRRRLSSELTEDICKNQETTDNTIFKCELNNEKNQCIEIPISECNYTTSTTDLTEETCKKKKISDNTIYKCVLKADKKGCVETIISRCKSTKGRRLSTALSEDICKELETSDNSIYRCFYDEKEDKCDETYLISECKSKRPSTNSRRLSSELTENDCINLATSNNNKKCVLKTTTKTECEEVDKENSHTLKLSFAILCLLLLI